MLTDTDSFILAGIHFLTYFGGTLATFISLMVLGYVTKRRRKQILDKDPSVSRELKDGEKILFLALIIASLLFTASLFFALINEGIALTTLGIVVEVMFILLLLVNLTIAVFKTSYLPSNKEHLDCNSRPSNLETASFTIAFLGLRADPRS
jgi:hypothetical protein